MNYSLSDSELQRYGRHVILPEMGEDGQAKLIQAKVMVVGAGGLGSAALLYLAAAGIGDIAIIDHDNVDISNLQRQVIHNSYDIGRAKTQSATETLQDLNPNCKIKPIRERLNHHNAAELVAPYDAVIDGCDNFDARYALADACAIAQKPLISAAVVRMEGQITLFKPYIKDAPCYRCLYPEAPDAAKTPRCDTVGILGPVAGLLGTCQAIETIKEIAQIGQNLLGRLILVNALSLQFYEINIKQNPNCSFCKGLKKQNSN